MNSCFCLVDKDETEKDQYFFFVEYIFTFDRMFPFLKCADVEKHPGNGTTSCQLFNTSMCKYVYKLMYNTIVHNLL